MKGNKIVNNLLLIIYCAFWAMWCSVEGFFSWPLIFMIITVVIIGIYNTRTTSKENKE